MAWMIKVYVDVMNINLQKIELKTDNQEIDRKLQNWSINSRIKIMQLFDGVLFVSKLFPLDAWK